MDKTRLENKAKSLQQEQQALQGVVKHLANVTEVKFAGVTMTPDELKSVLQESIDAIQALEAQRAATKKQLVVTREAHMKSSALRAMLKSYLIGIYGRSAVDVFHDFGMTVPKRASGPKTVEAKANAIALGRATREARHTMGRKQKSLIKGRLPEPTE